MGRAPREPALMKLTRRTLLKSGAATALLALTGCGSDGTFAGGEPVPGVGPPSEEPIVSLAIHPAIGIARVGNSPDGWFLGPEVPAAPLTGPFRDPSGALRRQAARFRVYGLDAQGRPVREVTDVQWSAHMMNRKAAWYEFETPLDIPEAVPTKLRNPGVPRGDLTIDGGRREIVGRSSGPVTFEGFFQGRPVTLGELRTDAAGRLLVLGGRGTSASPTGAPLVGFANSDGWYDDIADGPVFARAVVDGRVLEAPPAWVISAPPNYAPSLGTDYRTLYDVMYQTMLTAGRLSAPATVSFAADIFPLFDRLTQLQWVNQGLAERYGWGGPEYFLDPVLLGRLISDAGLRRALFESFRPPDTTELLPAALPPYYGDAITLPASSPRNWLTVTPYQYECLRRWAEGDFVADAARNLGHLLDEVPLALQPAALDRAALEACLGTAFHPGCEATWPMRHAGMYSGLFRLRLREGPEPDFGPVLTPAQALSLLDGSRPGDVSRWMAVPWQIDTFSCRSAYEPALDPYLPTFWPARVPNDVLTEADYQTVLDRSLPLAQRLEAFRRRAKWLRDMPSKQAMVTDWYRLGLVLERPGPGEAAFPSVLKVETL